MPGQATGTQNLSCGSNLKREKRASVRRRHVGPLVVQRPFHPEADGTAHVYLLHPPGGVAGGDRLEIACHVAPGARAVLTTPGAAKFYRSPHSLSALRTVIDVGADAACEYLPQETILFDGANASIETRISLAANATYVGWEFISFGRPAAGEGFTWGTARQRVEVLRAGRPIWFNVSTWTADRRFIGLRFRVRRKADRRHHGLCRSNGRDFSAERIREAVGEAAAQGVFSLSHLNRLLYAAISAHACRRANRSSSALGMCCAM